MSSFSHGSLLDGLLECVLAAGRVQLACRQRGVAVETKADTTPVTLADRESEAIILAGLAAVAPGVPVVAEEAMAEGRMPDVGQRFFLVDPLDGTREFIAGRDEFTINIALIDDRRPVFGIVYAPAVARLFATSAAGAAIEATVPATATARRCADLAVNAIHAREPDPHGLVAVASRSHMTAETEAFLARFKIRECRSAGSSLKFCLVGRGEADVYPRLGGRTNEWDTAAGHAILNAAGGSVVQPGGSPFLYGKSDVRFANGDYVAWGRTRVIPADGTPRVTSTT